MASVTRWEAIARDVEEQIANRSFEPGQQLPSETDLCRTYGVSRMTLRQAMGVLEAKNLLVRVQGKGTFVADRAIHRHGNVLGSFYQEMGVSEDELETRVISIQVVPPPEGVAEQLMLTDNQTTLEYKRIRALSHRPISSQIAWVPYLLDPGLARVPLINGSIYRTLYERLGIEINRAQQEVTASAATEEQAEILGCAVGQPLIDVRRISYDTTGRPVISARSWTLPEFSLTYELKR